MIMGLVWSKYKIVCGRHLPCQGTGQCREVIEGRRWTRFMANVLRDRK
jgi:hypothetical protein